MPRGILALMRDDIDGERESEGTDSVLDKFC